MIGPPLTASKQRTLTFEGIGPLPRSIVDTTRGDHDDLSREDVRLGCLGHGVLLEAVMFRKKTPTPIELEVILQRIAEIDHKFKQTDTWLHPTLAKDARERELLVAKANRQFDAGLKHEWR